MAHPKHTCWLMFLFSSLLQNSTIKVSAQVTATSLVYEGYPVQLQCGCSSYNTTWKFFPNTDDRQGKLIYRNENIIGRFNGRFNVDNNETEFLSFLKNEHVSVQDTGYYTCHCDDKNTVSQTLLQVVPNGYPNCSVRVRHTKSILEYGKVGQNIILTCNSGFDSNYPTIRWLRHEATTSGVVTSWFREETQLLDAYSFKSKTVLGKAMKLTENDEDVTYTCILGNGSVVSAPSCSVMPLRYRPRVNINPNLEETNVGENVTFNCSVSFEKNKPSLSDLIYAWNDTILDQFSGRFVLDNENRSLHLLDLKYSDDFTVLYCRVTITRTGAQDKAVALLRVNGSGINTTPPHAPYTSTQTYSTSFIITHSTLVTFYTSPSELLATTTLVNDIHLYLWISLVVVSLSVVTLGLCIYILHKRSTNARDGLTIRMLSVKYEEIKPKTAVDSKSNAQIVCGIVEPVEGKNSSHYEEVPDYELNNVTFCGTGISNSEKYGRNLGVQNEDTPATKAEERNDLIKSESPYAHVDETKFTEISRPLSNPSIGSAKAGERTGDTSPVYATVNKT